MQQVKNFPYIPVKIPRHNILKRLGYHSRKVEISNGMMDEVDGLIEKAADLIELKGLSLRSGIEIDVLSGRILITETGIVFESKKLCDFLAGSDQILIMGITGGAAASDEIRRLQDEKQLASAVVIDAAASEIVDDGFDYIAAIYSKELVRESRLLTKRRFSAGYGDFDIRFQKDIYSMLGFDKLGIEITDSCMLLPEKSVTAIYGIYGE